MTFADSFYRQPASAEKTVDAERFHRVLGTGGIKATGGRKQW